MSIRGLFQLLWIAVVMVVVELSCFHNGAGAWESRQRWREGIGSSGFAANEDVS